MRDRFRGRLTFPIQDLQGRHIGFGARVLPSDARAGEQAKYLNTAETPIYRKHEVLYNMHRARQAVAKTGDVFVVEGYTDVIGLAQAGITNVVATCGTALGERHFEQLSRFADAGDPVVRLRRGGRAGGRACVRVPGAVPDHRRRPDHARRARPGRLRGQARRRRGRGRPPPRPARSSNTWCGARSSGTTSSRSRGSRPRSRRRPADPRAPRRPDPAVGVRGLARRPRRRLARVGRAVALAPPRRQARGGRHDDEARHRARAARARGRPVDRARRSRTGPRSDHRRERLLDAEATTRSSSRCATRAGTAARSSGRRRRSVRRRSPP